MAAADTAAAGDDTAGSGDDTAAAGDDTAGSGDDTAGTGSETGAPSSYTEAQVTAVSARLHETFGSLIYVSWEQGADASVYVEFSFDEGEWLSSPPIGASVGPQEQLLLGVPYEAEVTYRVVNDFGDGPLASEEGTITADPLPPGMPQTSLLSATPDKLDSGGRYLLTSLWESILIIDREGRPVWAWDVPNWRCNMFVRPSWDGSDLLIDHNSFWGAFDGGVNSEILRVKIDGTEVETYATPGLHHPFTDLPDGSIIWGAASDYSDETLEKIDPDGNVETLWSCAEFLAATNATWGNYCGSNTIFYHEAEDTLLFSFYSLDTVVEIDHATGETLRHFGHVGDGVWSFDPPESAFWWQHGPNYTEDGTLLISTKDEENGRETVVREYALDEGSETLVQIWSFGEGEGVYGAEGGEAHRLSNGNTLHNYGSALRVREVTADGEVVWDVQWTGAGWLGKSVFLDDLYAFAP